MTEIQKIINHNYEPSNANKLNNLEEKNKFLEIYNIIKLNREETENSNSPIMSKGIESVVKNLPTKKSLGLH